MVLSETVAHHPELGSRFIFAVDVEPMAGDVSYVETFEQAKAILRDDLETRRDCDPDMSRDEERELSDALDELDAADGPEFYVRACGGAWWIDCLEVTEREWREIRDSEV